MSGYNSYLDQLQESQQKQDALQGSLAQAATTSPDQFADDVRLAKAAGMAVESVPDFKDEAQQARLIGEAGIDRIWQDHPKTAEWLTNPNNAKISSDSIPALKGIEQTFRNIGGALSAAVPAFWGGVSGFNRAAAELSAEGIGAWTRTLGYQKPGGLEDWLRDYARVQSGLQSVYRRETESLTPKTDNPVMAGIYSGITGAAQMAPTLPMLMTPETAPLFWPSILVPLAGEQYGQAREAGASPGMAAVSAAEHAAILRIVGENPLSRYVEDIAVGAPFWKRVAGHLGEGNVAMQLQTHLGDFADWANQHPEKPFREFIQERPQAALETLASATTMIAGTQAVTEAIPRSLWHLAKAEQAHRDAAFIDQLSKQSAEHPVRERDSDAFEAFIAHQAAGSPVENLYVDGHAMSEILNQAGPERTRELENAMPGITNEVVTAATTGGDVVIPTSKYAAKLAGTDIGEALKQHLRVDPESFSMAEASEIMKNRQAMIDEASEIMQQKASLHDDFTAQAKSVESDVMDQIKATGAYSNEQARNYSHFIRDFVVTNSARMSVPPEEFWKKYRMQISGGNVNTGGVLRQTSVQWYYSAISRAFETAKQESMPAGQWGQWLKSNSGKLGVKQDEIQWTGIEEYLKLRGKEKVTKQEIAEYLKKNGVQVQEVEKGGKPPVYPPDSYMHPDTGDVDTLENWRSMTDDHTDDGGESIDEQLDALIDVSGDPIQGKFDDTKYSEWQTPGGQNYRELLLKLPGVFREIPTYDDWVIQNKADDWGEENPLAGFFGEPDLSREQYYREMRVRKNPHSAKANFHSTHWDEPDILAHIRFNDRTDADGKRVLFIEEVQSDWGQAGRSGGFLRSANSGGWTAKESGGGFFKVYRGDGEFLGEHRASSEADAIRVAAQNVGSGAVPSAPFVTDTKAWVSLAIKRMIRYASENGYDKVAFINGEQSADRYDLSKQVDGVQVQPASNPDKVHVFVKQKGAKEYQRLGDTSAVEKSKLPDVLGKELAQKVLADIESDPEGVHEYEGLDLKVGGDGMKAFYDTIVPSVAKDIIKKWGGKIDTISLSESAAIARQDRHTGRYYVGEYSPQFDTREEANAWAKENQGTQAAFTITPEMRKSVLEGQPLFQGGQEPRGGFDPATLTTILTTKADASTFIHESGHYFLTVLADMAKMPDADQQIRDDFATVMEWAGVASPDEWHSMTTEQQRKAHEKWAYSFEQYLAEGTAPSVKMQGIFDRFRSWLVAVYKNVREKLNDTYKAEHGEDLPILTGEVRQVMDRMLASEEDILHAEMVRDMTPVFQTQEQSGMDDGMWTAYKGLHQEAHDQAVTDLTRDSIQQMKWLGNARSKILKDMQREVAGVRREVRNEVAAEVTEEPTYKAIRYLKDAEGSAKLDIDAVRAMFPKEDMVPLGRGRFALASKTGMDPDMAAGIFGFSSGEELVKALLKARKFEDEVDARTDSRMLQEHSELTDPKKLERAVELALHNEARTRFVAAELRYLQKIETPARVLSEAAKSAAQGILGRKPIRDIRPRDFSMAEARASKDAIASMKKGDNQGATMAKRRQLLQNQLATLAYQAKAEIDKSVAGFKRFFKPDAKISKSRNTDLINAGRAILSIYGIGPESGQMNPLGYIEAIAKYDPELLNDLRPMLNDAIENGKGYKDLALDDFRALKCTMDALWFLSKRDHDIMIDGRRMEVKAAVEDLYGRLDDIGIPDTVPGDRSALTPKEKAGRLIHGSLAMLTRVEHWASYMDGGDNGPFTRYIWRPIQQAIDSYETERAVYLKKYVDEVAKLSLPKGLIEAPEIGYTFGKGNGGNGKAELVGALLHTGNESNYRKLLLGRGWGLRLEDGTLNPDPFEKFMARMRQEGRVTKADYDFCQAVWDLNEEIKPKAQKTHHDLFGYYFKEVPANPVKNELGEWAGGYVPAKVDPDIVRDAQRNEKMGEIEADFRSSMPSTGMGFTKSRVDYNKALSLDLRLQTKHLDDVLRFVHIQPAVKDVLKILRSRDFSDAITRVDPHIIEQVLLPWLQRAATQRVTVPGSNPMVDKFWNAVRRNTGIAVLGFNFTNTLHYVTGLIPAAIKVQPRHLSGAFRDYAFNSKAMSDQIAELSPYMANHMKEQIWGMHEILNDIVANPNDYEKVKTWVNRHAMFMQEGTRNFINNVTWLGKYNQAIEEIGAGPDDAAAIREAVQQADGAVRMTQHSLGPADIARYEAGSPFVRAITQMSGYMNNMANLNVSEYSKIIRDMGFKAGAGKLLYAAMIGLWIPALAREAILNTMGGRWKGPDDDGYLLDWLGWFFGSPIKATVESVPAAGNAIVGVWDAATGKFDEGKLTQVPAISNVGTGLKAVNEIKGNMIDGRDVTGREIRDVGTLISLITGMPLTPVSKAAGYEFDVQGGDIEPSGPVDRARGIVSGKPSEGTRR